VQELETWSMLAEDEHRFTASLTIPPSLLARANQVIE
jgi:hypothetical protein